MSTKKKNKEIWIESCTCENNTRTLTISPEWGCCKGFRKSDCKKLFDAVSAAVKTVFPDAVVNPWTNDKPGIPDFD